MKRWKIWQSSKSKRAEHSRATGSVAKDFDLQSLFTPDPLVGGLNKVACTKLRGKNTYFLAKSTLRNLQMYFPAETLLKLWSWWIGHCACPQTLQILCNFQSVLFITSSHSSVGLILVAMSVRHHCIWQYPSLPQKPEQFNRRSSSMASVRLNSDTITGFCSGRHSPQRVPFLFL